MKAKILVFYMLLFCNVPQVKPLIIGSDIAVSVESLVNFPLIDDNIIRSFAWMKSGFTLEDNGTELDFRSIFPVSGTVNLRGGILTLSTDLILKNVTTLSGLGAVFGNGHAMEICSGIKELPADTRQFDTTDLFFNNDLKLKSVIRFSGICLLSGNSNKLDLTSGAIRVDSNSKLHISNLDLIGIKEGAIYCADDTACIILDNVNWIQDASTTFSVGSIKFCDQVTFCGTGTFFLSSKLTSTISDSSVWKLSDDLTLVSGRHTINNAEPIYFESERSTLYLDNIGFQCPTTGMSLTNGTLVFNRDVNLEFLGTTTQTGVILGNGNVANDIHVLLNPGTTIDLQDGYWVYNNGKKDRIQSNSTSAKLIRRENSYVYVAKDLELRRCTIEIASEMVLPIDVALGATLSYCGSVVQLPNVELDIKANQVGAYTYQLDGNDSIFFTRGTLPFALLITGQTNRAKGNGTISGPIIFSDSVSELFLGISGELQNYINLNNGTLKLDSPLALNNNGIINGPGKIDLATYNIALSRTVATWPTSVQWLSSRAEIGLLGTLSLLDTWTFSGNVTLNGYGNTLDLANSGELVVGANSMLTLKNIQIAGVGGNNIRCIDNSGTLSLLNARLFLDDNYSFTQGHIYCMRDNILSGSYDFSYETVYTSSIAIDASLTCAGGLNFKLGKSSAHATAQPLIFADKTSKLILDQATLNVQQYGYQLTKGTIVSNRSNAFEIQSTHTGNGLMLGNGISNEDITIQLNPGSKLDLKKGHLVYNLSNPVEGIVGQVQTAQLSRSVSFMTHFMRDADLSNISYVLNPPALFTQDPGVQVTFSNVLAVTPVGQFNVTGRRVSIVQIALDGNDKVEVKSGQFPSLLSVSGTGNTISGEGAVNGVVSFVDSSARLASSLTGPYLQTIMLNGGILTLGSASRLGNAIALTGPGTITMGAQALELGQSKTTWSTPLLWQGTSSTIGLHANVSLQSTWTFSGNVAIKGNGFALNLSDSAEILLADNTKLTLEGLKVENLSGTKIRCSGNNSTLVLDNVTLEQGGDYHFNAGALCIKGKVTIKGVPSIFGYETDQTSTIHAESYLKLDESCTFSYDPSNAKNNLIEFEDASSLLFLDQATLITTHTGLHFTKGAIEVRGDAVFKSYKKRNEDDTFEDPGIVLGDGMVEDNDTQLIVEGGAWLKIAYGSLRYNNLKPFSLLCGNRLSRIQFFQDTILYLHENMDLGDGILLLERGADIERDSGKVLTGAVVII